MNRFEVVLVVWSLVLLITAICNAAPTKDVVLVSQCVDLPSPVNKQSCLTITQQACSDLAVNFTVGKDSIVNQRFSIDEIANQETEIQCRDMNIPGMSCRNCFSITNVAVQDTYIHGCATQEVKCGRDHSISRTELGCFDIQNCTARCPRNCSGRGVCGTGDVGCQCSAGFVGRDCSIELRDGCVTTGASPKTCVDVEAINCTQFTVNVTIGSESVVQSFSAAQLLNVSDDDSNENTLVCQSAGPCAACAAVSEFAISGPNFTACTEATVMCGDIELGQFALGCQTHQFLTSDCDLNTCFNNCSGRGVCENGQCGCIGGYSGIDCSVAVQDGCIRATVSGTEFMTCLSVAVQSCNTLQIALQGDTEKTWYFSVPDLEDSLPPPSCYDAFPGCQLCVTLTDLQLPGDDIGDAVSNSTASQNVSGSFSYGLTCAGLPMGDFPEQDFEAPLETSCNGRICIVSNNDSAMLMDVQASARMEIGEKWFAHMPIPGALDIVELQFLLSIPEFSPPFDFYTSSWCHPTLEVYENHARLSGARNSGIVVVSALNCSDTGHANTLAGTWYVGLRCGPLNCSGGSCPRCNIGVTPHMLLAQNGTSNASSLYSFQSAFSLSPGEKRYYSVYAEGTHKPVEIRVQADGAIQQVLVSDYRCMTTSNALAVGQPSDDTRQRYVLKAALTKQRHFLMVQASASNDGPVNVTLNVGEEHIRSLSFMFILLALLLVGVLGLIAAIGYRSYAQHWRDANYTANDAPNRGHFTKLNTSAADELDDDANNALDDGELGRASTVLGSAEKDSNTLTMDSADDLNEPEEIK